MTTRADDPQLIGELDAGHMETARKVAS